MDLPEYLTRGPLGEIRLTGHRIDLYHFVYYYNEGYSAEMLLCQFPTLRLALIHKVIAFYLDNRTEVDAYVAEVQAQIQEQRATGLHVPGLVEFEKEAWGQGARRAHAREAGLSDGAAVSARREPSRPTLEGSGGCQSERRAQVEITRVGDEPDLPFSSEDPDILRWAEREGFILVSTDIHDARLSRSSPSSGGPLAGRLPRPTAMFGPGAGRWISVLADDRDETYWRDRLFHLP